MRDMEPFIPTLRKRPCSSFIPYRKTADGFEYFLQKRDQKTRVAPGMFSLFGGGIEKGETPLEGCEREVLEALTYTPKNLQYLTKFETSDVVVHSYFEKVGSDFESRVKVCEGEYGQFMTKDRIRGALDVSLLAQLAVVELERFLREHE